MSKHHRGYHKVEHKLILLVRCEGGGAEGLGGAGRKRGRKGWGAGGGEEHEYPVFHLFLV